MKLTTKIAGSMALPLALAVAANSAQAFTVVDNDDHKITIGGYLSAIASWHKDGSKKSGVANDKFNNSMSAGTSRLNLGYTDKATGTRFFYEQQFQGGLGNASNGLRHAFFETADGIVGGHTWSFGTNLVALAETIDTDGNSNVSYQAYGPRNLVLGKKFKLDDSMTVGLALEDGSTGNGLDTREKSIAPSVVANFQGQFGDTKVFAAWTNYTLNVEKVEANPQVDFDINGNPTGYNNAVTKGKDKRVNRLTFGTSTDLGAANIKLGLTHNFGVKHNSAQMIDEDNARAAKGTHVSGALGFKVNEKVRTNLVVEHSIWDKKAINKVDKENKDGKATRVWLNAFYQADNGIEWGAEYQYADIDADDVTYSSVSGNLADGGQAIRLQAKYAF